MAVAPLVSAVIPTRNRPELVIRAVHSALAQTYKRLEVIVVIDGPDADTESALRAIGDPRLLILSLPMSVGGSDARNAGVRSACGEWIAFLDDDDLWLPRKIEKQLDVAVGSRFSQPIVCCHFIGRTPTADYIWPRRKPRDGEPICEYLLVRKSIFRGEGHIQTSLILARRELLVEVPFTSGLRKWQDIDWCLRVAAVDGVGVEFADNVLAIWHVEDERPKITKDCDWRNSLEWLRLCRHFITPRAYSGFIATQLAWEASRQADWTAFLPLLGEAFKWGDVKPLDFYLYIGIWVIPVKVRRMLRRIVRFLSPRRIEGTAKP